jgi:hypothetical protein
MKRDVVITVLLIFAGIILAGCPVRRGAFWKGGSSPRGSSQVVSARVTRLCLIDVSALSEARFHEKSVHEQGAPARVR